MDKVHKRPEIIPEQTEFQHLIKDDYVEILLGNVEPGTEANFLKENNSYTFDEPYDGRSVMHYRQKAFGIRVNKTCVGSEKECLKTTIKPLVCT